MTHHHHSRDPLAKRVFDRIEEGNLVPRPRWEYVLKNYVFWALGACAVLVGAFAFAAAMFEVQNAGWRYAAATHSNFFTFFLSAAPLLWVLVVAVFIALGYINIRRTHRGYRYSLAVIALGAVLTSVALGGVLYVTGFGAEIEESIGDHPPFYRPILSEEREWWVAPESGLLGGTVMSLASSTQAFMLEDFSGQVWTVSVTDLRNNDLTTVSHGGIVRVVGVPASATSSVFHACFVFPWKVYGRANDVFPPPPIFVPPQIETMSKTPRSEECRGIRPYTSLRSLDKDGF